MMRFTLPRDIYHGKNALAALRTLKGRRAFIVTGGSSMKKSGFLQQTQGYLESAGFRTHLFEGVEPDPSVDTVKRGAEEMRSFEPDWIVAIGGGSPIDAAKAMWVFYEHPNVTFEQLTVPFSFPPLRTRARFCAIPSTSGTATEVTAFSVITDYGKGVKYPLADFNITPDVAIVDPAVAADMPQTLAAYTGMDAFTHALEAYVSTMRCAYTDPLAMAALKTVNRRILEAYKGDISARAEMHDAQCLAGMAFSNALLGITHSMAHKTGAAFSGGHIVHGCANAMYLPKVIAFNARDEETASRYAEVARELGLEQSVQALIGRVRELNAGLSIPARIQDYERGIIGEKEFKELLPRIAEGAVEDACTGSNPRKISVAEMEKLLECCYYDTEVDF